MCQAEDVEYCRTLIFNHLPWAPGYIFLPFFTSLSLPLSLSHSVSFSPVAKLIQAWWEVGPCVLAYGFLGKHFYWAEHTCYMCSESFAIALLKHRSHKRKRKNIKIKIRGGKKNSTVILSASSKRKMHALIGPWREARPLNVSPQNKLIPAQLFYQGWTRDPVPAGWLSMDILSVAGLSALLISRAIQLQVANKDADRRSLLS